MSAQRKRADVEDFSKSGYFYGWGNDLVLKTMRLSPSQIQAIRRTITALLGDDVRIVLFGSRVDDTAKGGDVDLMITTAHPITQRAFTAALLSAKLSRVLDGRQVDVVLNTPDTRPQPIHEAAQSKGVVL